MKVEHPKVVTLQEIGIFLDFEKKVRKVTIGKKEKKFKEWDAGFATYKKIPQSLYLIRQEYRKIKEDDTETGKRVYYSCVLPPTEG